MSSLPERVGRFAGGTAARGRWLSRGLLLLTLAEVAVLFKEHLDRLSPKERQRLVEIVKESKGRPRNVSDREREEIKKMIDKIGPAELARGVAGKATGLGGGRGRFGRR
jgi:hypothetical protein